MIDYLQIVNIVLTSVMTIYIVRVEHRFTRLETYVEILIKEKSHER